MLDWVNFNFGNWKIIWASKIALAFWTIDTYWRWCLISVSEIWVRTLIYIAFISKIEIMTSSKSWQIGLSWINWILLKLLFMFGFVSDWKDKSIFIWNIARAIIPIYRAIASENFAFSALDYSKSRASPIAIFMKLISRKVFLAASIKDLSYDSSIKQLVYEGVLFNGQRNLRIFEASAETHSFNQVVIKINRKKVDQIQNWLRRKDLF